MVPVILIVIVLLISKPEGHRTDESTIKITSTITKTAHDAKSPPYL